MVKIVSVRVPDDVSEEDVIQMGIGGACSKDG